MWVQTLGWEDPLQEGLATHSTIVAWRVPWTEDPCLFTLLNRRFSKTSRQIREITYESMHVCVCGGGMHVLVTQSCPTLCYSTDCSQPGSSVHGILQARILEWVAVPFFRGSSDPGIKFGSLALQATPGTPMILSKDCDLIKSRLEPEICL